MIPNKPGTYLVKCEESGGDWTQVRILKTASRTGESILMVDDPDIGSRLLDDYHNALTDIEWKLIGW